MGEGPGSRLTEKCYGEYGHDGFQSDFTPQPNCHEVKLDIAGGGRFYMAACGLAIASCMFLDQTDASECRFAANLHGRSDGF